MNVKYAKIQEFLMIFQRREGKKGIKGRTENH
jgi:hypothetical protein